MYLLRRGRDSVALVARLFRFARNLAHSIDHHSRRPKGAPTLGSNPSFSHNGKGHKCIHICGLPIAERAGFEPAIQLPVCYLSKVVHSTALPPLRRAIIPHLSVSCDDTFAILNRQYDWQNLLYFRIFFCNGNACWSVSVCDCFCYFV